MESIVRVINVPLTVDVEAGYSDDLGRVAEVLDAVIAAGAVGINIEDGSADPDLLARKIELARTVANERDVKLFINARTDVYLRALVPAEDRVAETLRRAALYQAAGTDGCSPPRHGSLRDRSDLQGHFIASQCAGVAGLPSPSSCKRWACAD